MNRRAVNRLEVKALYEHGKNGRFLSLAGMARDLDVSRTTLREHLAAMRAAGELDEIARQRLHHRAGRDRGGHRRARISFDVDELVALRAAGLGPSRILKVAQSLPRRATVGHVRRILAELDVTREKVQGPALERGLPKAAEGGAPQEFSTNVAVAASSARGSTKRNAASTTAGRATDLHAGDELRPRRARVARR